MINQKTFDEQSKAERNRIGCSVTQEMVEQLANSNKRKYYDGNNNVNLGKVLFDLGFKIETNGAFRGYYTIKDVYVRDYNKPEMVYKTTVYNGEVRNTIKCYKTDGSPLYTGVKHMLASTYEGVGVLQPVNLYSLVDEDRFTNIQHIGCVKAYNDGFDRMDKPSNNDRNIVRN